METGASPVRKITTWDMQTGNWKDDIKLLLMPQSKHAVPLTFLSLLLALFAPSPLFLSHPLSYRVTRRGSSVARAERGQGCRNFI